MIRNVVNLRQFIKKIKKRKQETELTVDDGCTYDNSMEAFHADMKFVENNVKEVLNEIEKIKDKDNYIEKISDNLGVDELVEKEEIENEIVEAEVQMESIEDEMEINEKEISDLENLLKDLNDNKIKMERELDEKTFKLYNYERESNKVDIKKLNNEVTKLIACIDSLNKHNDELNKQKKSLESELYETQCIFEEIQEKFFIIEKLGKKEKLDQGAELRRKSYAATSYLCGEMAKLKHSQSDEKKIHLKQAKENEAEKQSLENQAKDMAIETSKKNTLLLKIQNEKKEIEKEIENQSRILKAKKAEHKSLADIIEPKIDLLKSDISETKLIIDNIRVQIKNCETKRKDKEVNKRLFERNKAKINKLIQRLENSLNGTKSEVNFTLASLRELEKLKFLSSDS
jgi:hypothetical protein